MSRLAWALILLSASLASAQQQTIEITKTDFTKADSIRSTSLSVFGIKLGDTLKEAEVSAGFFGATIDSKATKEWEGWTFSLSSGCQFSIQTEDGKVSRISLRNGCAIHLAGDAKHLLDSGITASSSDERLRLLGREDKADRTAFPGNGGVLSTLTYDREGVQLGSFFDGKTESVTLHFIAPAKSRS